MSLILDALRRAEEARARELSFRISHGLPLHRRRTRTWLWVLAAAGVVAGVVWVVMQMLVPQPVSMPTAAVTSSAVPPLAVGAPSAPVGAASTHEGAPEPGRDPPRGSSLADIALPEPPTTFEPPRSNAALLHELPAPVLESIPALTMNAHVWAQDPGRRFILLNMRRFTDGDIVQDGLRVIAVLPEGAELEWRGTRFRLLSQ